MYYNLPAHEQNIISLWNLNSLQNNLRKFPPIKIYLFLFYHQQRKHISTEAAGNLDRRLFLDRKNVLTENYISLEPLPVTWTESNSIYWGEWERVTPAPPAGRTTQTPGAPLILSIRIIVSWVVLGHTLATTPPSSVQHLARLIRPPGRFSLLV